MPLSLTVADGGRTGLALRRLRGDHALHGTGQCLRLATLIPSHVQLAGDHAVIPHRVAMFIALPSIGLQEAAKAQHIYNRMVGHERMGAALDKCLSLLSGDAPRNPSVLRAELRAVARSLLAENEGAILADVADLYEVGPASFPTGDGIDDAFEWFGYITMGECLDAEGFLSIAAYYELCLSPRFDSDVALAPTGPVDRLCELITKSVEPDLEPLLVELDDGQEMARELTTWLGRVLPAPVVFVEYPETVSAWIIFSRGSPSWRRRGT